LPETGGSKPKSVFKETQKQERSKKRQPRNGEEKSKRKFTKQLMGENVYPIKFLSTEKKLLPKNILFN